MSALTLPNGLALALAIALTQPTVALADSFPLSYLVALEKQATAGPAIDLSKLVPGESLTLQYAGRPVVVYRRTKADLLHLGGAKDGAATAAQQFRAAIRREYGSTSSSTWARLLLTAQPVSTSHPYRSISREFLVIGGWSPTTGCVLTKPVQPTPDPTRVFRDPCSGTDFDAAGQETRDGNRTAVFIAVPPYSLEGTSVRVGVPQGAPLPELPFTRDELLGHGTPTQRLIAAAKYNDIEAVRVALRDGADANHFRIGEGSPLDAAIIGSSIEIVQLLLQAGAKPTPNSESAAAFVGRTELLSMLRAVK